VSWGVGVVKGGVWTAGGGSVMTWRAYRHLPSRGAAGREQESWRGDEADCTAAELSQLLYWLLITGWQLHGLEMRLDMAVHALLAEGGAGAAGRGSWHLDGGDDGSAGAGGGWPHIGLPPSR
jgi:hypothetical protein